jgi:uncharacterized membrane protein
MNYVKLYLLMAVALFAIDFIWLTRIAEPFYHRHLGHLLRADPLVGAAAAFYALYIVGIIVFAVVPALEADSLGRALVLGGFLGLVAFATFDLTCRALFKDFPMIVVWVDLSWGLTLTGSVAAAGYGIGRWLGMG